MKRRGLCILLLLVALLVGCKDRQDIAQQNTTEAAIQETTQQKIPETTLPEISLESINVLSARSSATAPEICVLDARTVAFLTVDYVDKDFSSKQTNILLLDIYTDTVLEEATLEGEYRQMEAFCDMIALGSEKEQQILLLDRTLQQVASFRANDINGVVTSDQAYYYLWGSNLYRVDILSGESERITLARELPLVEILSYDPENNWIMCKAFVNPYTVGTCMAAVDLDEETFFFLNGDFVGGGATKDGFFLQGQSELMVSDICYGQWEKDTVYVLDDFLVNNGKISSWHIPGTDYVYQLHYTQDQVGVETVELYRLGQTLQVCSLPEPLNEVKAKQVIGLPDGNLLVLEVNRRNYQVYLICPELLTFEEAMTPQAETLELVDEAIFDSYDQAAVTEEVGEHLLQVRQTADAMEDEYGVTILMSNQCTAAAQSSSKPITTTDQAALTDEDLWIQYALGELDDALDQYPKDFFRQFRNEVQQKGILILLVEDISDDLNVIGICYTMGDWTIVAVDITSGQVLQTYYHELWHAMEFKMMEDNPMVFQPEVWDACNPEGYFYTYDTTPGYIYDVENTLFNDERKENIYFIDPYAKTNPYEDRARLMEYVMYSDYYAGRIVNIPALRKKLEIMAGAVRESFDTTGWKTPYWERYIGK